MILDWPAPSIRQFDSNLDLPCRQSCIRAAVKRRRKDANVTARVQVIESVESIHGYFQPASLILYREGDLLCDTEVGIHFRRSITRVSPDARRTVIHYRIVIVVSTGGNVERNS